MKNVRVDCKRCKIVRNLMVISNQKILASVQVMYYRLLFRTECTESTHLYVYKMKHKTSVQMIHQTNNKYSNFKIVQMFDLTSSITYIRIFVNYYLDGNVIFHFASPSFLGEF